jgi:hypothetical protein
MRPGNERVTVATGVVTALSHGLPLLRAEQAVWKTQKTWERLELLVTETETGSCA